MKYILGIVAVVIAVIGLGYLWAPVGAPAETDLYGYEYEAAGADECATTESFDDAAGVCYYQCADQAECDALLGAADTELDGWADEYAQSGGYSTEHASNWSDDSDGVQGEEGDGAAESEPQAIYTVTNERITLTSGTEGTDDRAIWDAIAQIAPNDFSNAYIETYQVFRDDGDTLAYVSDDDGNGKWAVSVNAQGYEAGTPRERVVTLVHELGHIVTLNTTQVDPNVDEAACTGFFTGSEGCAGTASYLAQFVKTFWNEEDLATVGGGTGEGSTGIYDQDPTRFVTEYASTNPIEDAAESWALFVLDNGAVGDTVAQQKVRFYEQFPALQTFRAQMRAGLQNGVIRARLAR